MRTPDQNDFRALVTRPRPAFSRELGRALQMRAEEIGLRKPRHVSIFPWAFRFGMATAAFLLVTTSVLAYSSPRVTRTSPIYIIKRLGEGMLVSLAHTPSQRVSLQFHLASRRVAEANYLARTGAVDIETISEAHANAQTAAAIAAAFPSPANGDVESAKRAHTNALRTVSILAQMQAKRPMIVVDRDAFAMAPSRARVLPALSPPAASDGSIPASPPMRGAVAGSSPLSDPALTPPPEEVRLTAKDPNVRALNAVIRASEDIETPRKTEEPKAQKPKTQDLKKGQEQVGNADTTPSPVDPGANR